MMTREVIPPYPWTGQAAAGSGKLLEKGREGSVACSLSPKLGFGKQVWCLVRRERRRFAARTEGGTWNHPGEAAALGPSLQDP